MRRWKKLLLILLVLVLLAQIPFAYRRYQLGKLHAAIQQLNSQRLTNANDFGLKEYKGVAHVHSSLGGHSPGTLQDIIEAAKLNQLDFVLMTEHPSKEFDTSAMTLKGLHDGVLFVNGNEVKSANGDRLLLLPGFEKSGSADHVSTEEILTQRVNDLNLVAYPDDFKTWNAEAIAGVEVYNVYSNAKHINAVVMFFDGLWSYRAYPDLLFATFFERPAASLRKWDELNANGSRRLVATAGNDAHANVGLNFNDSSGKTLVGFTLDPYERSFRLVRMHVLLPANAGSELKENTLLDAVKAGHCFIGFDLFGDTSGFRFVAEDADERRVMGDEIKLESDLKLSVGLPITGRVLLLKNGSVVSDDSGVLSKDYKVSERGVYRVEVYLPQLPGRMKDQPWIISNPIYVR